MAIGINTAAPISSSAGSLGITSQPAITPQTPLAAPTTGGSPNAAVATGYSSTPAAGTSSVGDLAAAAQSVAASTQALAAGNTAPVAGNTAANQSTSGGGLGEFVGNAIERLAGFASTSMTRLKDKMNAEMTANGGQMDMAKLQMYSQEMSNFEAIMSMAKKIQDTENEARRVWLR